MLNYRVQTCIDSSTYDALVKYMENEGLEKTSTALRKILRIYFSTSAGESKL